MQNLAAVPWQTPPVRPGLSESEIHVWNLDLNAARVSKNTAAVLHEDFRSVLSSAELARADRFRFERDAYRFVIRRGMLRRILSTYIGMPAKEITFETNEHGKPQIANSGASRPLEFNTSHSQSVGLVAVSSGGRLGIDVECFRRNLDCSEIAKRFFSADEVTRIDSVEPSERLEMFYLYWTSKEAILKAMGSGLTIELERVLTGICDRNGSVRSRIAGGDENQDQWFQRSFLAVEGYVGAVVRDRPGERVSFFQSLIP